MNVKEELQQRIRKNRIRLGESYYQIDQVFMPAEYDWPGDKEGRALLAFVSHYKINGEIIPCMPQMIEKLAEKTNCFSYFGPTAQEPIFEQQLSGHSWYLRGLCEYYEQFNDERILDILKSTVKHLYYPTLGKFDTYPTERIEEEGGVSGHSIKEQNGWQLSSDVGCAFMSIDGLSHYYKITRDQRTKELLDEMILRFAQIDKIKIKAQTHCTLTAARGMLRMYELEKEPFYLENAENIYQLYRTQGMTLTYQNFNWWNRGDTWTEPCAIVDSVMVADTLWQLTGKEEYHRDAVRIFNNGLATSQRPNGGAGTDNTVSPTTPILKAQMYEAAFCCTMRLAEGLWYINQHPEHYIPDTDGELYRDSMGRYIKGDILYASLSDESLGNPEERVVMDGHSLYPIVKLFTLNDAQAMSLEQKIVF